MKNKNTNPTMRTTLIILALMAIMLGAMISGCSGSDGTEGSQESSGVERREHEREGGEINLLYILPLVSTSLR